jgi:hypothetical protein
VLWAATPAAILVTSLALSPAWPREGAVNAGDLFWAQPGSLPEWAEPGNVRFLRLDGGRIESRKAERTWWGRGFSATEKDILAHVYTRHFDQMLGLLKEARVSWIWVTWSNGWSFAEEAENRAQLQNVIQECHRHGIKVTAYLSSSNLFYWNTFRDEPESRRWLLYWHGLPVPYGGSPHRLLADVGRPDWRAYVLRKAGLALDAGADAVFYDNVFGSIPANKLLLSETQRLAQTKARQSGRTKALVYANVHPPPERFDMNDHCDVLWDESGTNSPGVWHGDWKVDNVRKLKFIAGEKQAWQPLMYENDVYECGPRETCIPTPVEHKLGIAEVQAFGAIPSRNIEGRFLAALIGNEPPARAAWAAIAQYHRFVAEHAWLYRGVEPVAKVAVLSRVEEDPVADDFIRRNVMFQTKVLRHLSKGAPLDSFRVLVVPFPVPRLDDGQRTILADFAVGGGTILAADVGRLRTELREAAEGRRTPLPPGALRALRHPEPGSDLCDEVNRAAGGPVVAIEHGPHVVASVTRHVATDTFIVHLLNYDLGSPAEKVHVKLDLSGYARDPERLHLTLLSPDAPAATPPLVRQDGILGFDVSRLQHYTVAVLTAGNLPASTSF